jgi:uncharacterized protein YfaS (alpha-2-macroglobulin family)
VAPAPPSPPVQPPENAGQHNRAQLEKATGNMQAAIPGIEVADARGRARIRFDLPDLVTGFRVLVDGHADGGRLGSGQIELVSRLPFWLEPRLPLEASPGDRIDVPLAIVNDSDQKLAVEVALENGQLVRLDGEPRRKLPLPPQQRSRESFALHVVGPSGDCPLTFRGSAGPRTHELTRSVKIVPPDYAGQPARSGQIDAGPSPVRLSTRLAKEKVPWGETVALSAELVNTSDSDQPMVVAVLGLPAGLDVQVDQLDEVQRAGKIDYYQTRAREIICHCRTLAPKDRVELKLDLIAAIPGKYTGPASCVYLDEATQPKHWNDPLVVEITAE